MQIDFFNKTGKLALGSRLRMLTSTITEDALKIFQLYGVGLQPKWFPVFYVLSEGTEKTITEIANEIGHSQPSVSKIISEMVKKGLVKEKKDPSDGRRNVVVLAKSGKEIIKIITDQYTDVENAVETILAQTKNDLWRAIEEWEVLLEQKSLLQRVKEERRKRESAHVKIIPYQPKYQAAFRDLNIEWISAYFDMEDSDYKALDNPKEYILKGGGHIFVALYKEEPVGVCALIKMDDPKYDFELAKMAVTPKAQGKNIGALLGEAAIEKARSLGASALYLGSNTVLQPAINLYYKLGFQRIMDHPTPYKRCNFQMELILKAQLYKR